MSSATAALRAAGAKNCGLDKIIAQCSDLAVQVVDGSHPGKACSFDYVGSVRNHQQLCNEEKHSLLWLLAQAPAFHGIIKASDLGEGHELPDWVKCAGMMGVHISRQDPDVSERVYKMRGVAEVPVSTEVGLCDLGPSTIFCQHSSTCCLMTAAEEGIAQIIQLLSWQQGRSKHYTGGTAHSTL